MSSMYFHIIGAIHVGNLLEGNEISLHAFFLKLNDFYVFCSDEIHFLPIKKYDVKEPGIYFLPLNGSHSSQVLNIFILMIT